MSHEPNAVWHTDIASLETPELTIIARSMIAARKALHGPLPSALIHDPALDLLLHLFIAEATQTAVKLSDVLEMTTIHDEGIFRWVAVLESYGFVQRSEAIIRLSAAGVDAVTLTLCAVARSQWQFSDDG